MSSRKEQSLLTRRKYPMDKDNPILIQNIFYMLSYAFQVLKQNNYKNMGAEEFEHIHDLLAAILAGGMAQLVKQGLHREYIERNETLPTLKGKLDMPETIRSRMQRKPLLSCSFDELSENNQLNQILKTTAWQLIKRQDVGKKQRQALKNVLFHFGDVDIIQLQTVNWSRLSYPRGNQIYPMVINICRFIWQEMLPNKQTDQYRMQEFTDRCLSGLFERFVREYYKTHYKSLIPREQSRKIEWNLDGMKPQRLPSMEADLKLCHNASDAMLIIDTKFYSHAMQKSHYGKETFHSQNLYQIFTYVKNQDKCNTGNVSGMLLYAKTNEDIALNASFLLGGNHFCIRTLDLNQNFQHIAQQLDNIAQSYFPGVKKQE